MFHHEVADYLLPRYTQKVSRIKQKLNLAPHQYKQM
jgi:hypothetical protein